MGGIFQIENQNALRPSRASVSTTATAKYSGFSPPPARDLKRKRGVEHQGSEAEAKVKEFLEVMQPPSKSRTWPNEDVHGGPPHPQSLPMAAHKPGLEPEDVEQQQPSRKPKDHPRCIVNREGASLSNPAASAQPSTTETSVLNDIRSESGESLPQASDADWLRSRTSRLLDLVDEDDEIVSKTSENQPEPGKSRGSTLYKDERDMSDAGSQREGDHKAKPVEPPESSKIDFPSPSIATGRLFVRNLAYTTTESDLRSYLEDIGSALPEEVSTLFTQSNDSSLLL